MSKYGDDKRYFVSFVICVLVCLSPRHTSFVQPKTLNEAGKQNKIALFLLCIPKIIKRNSSTVAVMIHARARDVHLPFDNEPFALAGWHKLVKEEFGEFSEVEIASFILAPP